MLLKIDNCRWRQVFNYALLLHPCFRDWCTLGQKCTPLEGPPAFPTFHGCQLDLKATAISLGIGRTLHMIVETMQNSVYQRSER